jgi:hypothetical protein
MSAMSFIDSRPDHERAQWLAVFQTVAAELSTALAKGGTIFQLSDKKIETPDGHTPYAEVLMYFENCSDKAHRETALRLWRQLSGEYFAIRKALEELDAADMPRA